MWAGNENFSDRSGVRSKKERKRGAREGKSMRALISWCFAWAKSKFKIKSMRPSDRVKRLPYSSSGRLPFARSRPIKSEIILASVMTDFGFLNESVNDDDEYGNVIGRQWKIFASRWCRKLIFKIIFEKLFFLWLKVDCVRRKNIKFWRWFWLRSNIGYYFKLVFLDRKNLPINF